MQAAWSRWSPTFTPTVGLYSRVLAGLLGVVCIGLLFAPGIVYAVVSALVSGLLTFAVDFGWLFAAVYFSAAAARLSNTLPNASPLTLLDTLHAVVPAASLAVLVWLAPVPAVWAYGITLLRASILPFTVYLGIRGLVLGAPVVHDNTIVQCLVFIILVGAILAAPGLVCRDVIPSLLSAAFWLIWAVATSLTVPVACVAMCRRAAGLQSLEAAAHVLIGLVAAVVWWFAFWTGWTASITQWLAALVPLYVSARCVVG